MSLTWANAREAPSGVRASSHWRHDGEMHESGNLIAPERSAAVLVEYLLSGESGAVWAFDGRDTRAS